MPRLDEVFKKSGVPTHTFVPPAEYDRVAVALKRPMGSEAAPECKVELLSDRLAG